MNADLRGFLGLLSAEICVNPRAIFIYVPVDVHIVGRNRLFQHPVRRLGVLDLLQLAFVEAELHLSE